MSEMREVTTVIRRSDSEIPQKLLVNGFQEQHQQQQQQHQHQQQIKPLNVLPHNDRNNNKEKSNNNNVAKKSQPPPIPPKRLSSKRIDAAAVDSNNSKVISSYVANELNNKVKYTSSRAAINDGSNEIIASNSPSSVVINCNQGQNAYRKEKVKAAAPAVNELHKLSVSSKRTINTNDTQSVIGCCGKGQNVRSDSSDDSVVATCAAAVRDDNPDNDGNSVVTPTNGCQIGLNSGTSNDCHNYNVTDPQQIETQPKAADKTAININSNNHLIDMVDSAVGVVCAVQQETETVTLKNDEQLQPQIGRNMTAAIKQASNGDKNVTVVDNNVMHNGHRNNCDNLCGVNETNNGRLGNNSISTVGVSDSGVGVDLSIDDDEDPYAELHFYLEKVKREINEVFEQRKLSDGSTSAETSSSLLQQHGFQPKANNITNCIGRDSSNNTTSNNRTCRTSAAIKNGINAKTRNEISRNNYNDEQQIPADEFDQTINPTTAKIPNHDSREIQASDGKHDSCEAPQYNHHRSIAFRNSNESRAEMMNYLSSNNGSGKLKFPTPFERKAIELRPTTLALGHNSNANITKTNEWASSILKELDNLMLANKQGTSSGSGVDMCTTNTNSSSVMSPVSPSSQKRSTIINVTLRKATPSTSPTTPTASVTTNTTTILSKQTNIEKNSTTNVAAAVSATTTVDNNNILKPEKHTYIPLQSFKFETPPCKDACTPTAKSNRKQQPIDILKKYSKQLNLPSSTSTPPLLPADSNFPVLKIEEDLDGISMTSSSHGCKTISTQTSPIGGDVVVGNKKAGSTSTLWTSEESILRSADTVDEDNKSTSSSACEETGGVISSGKSDCSGLDNDNVESGIGTATPPKEQENWRHLKGITQQQQRQRHVEPLTLTAFDKSWVRQENVMTQTTPPPPPLEINAQIRPTFKTNTSFPDDPDLLEVLSQCEGTTDEYDINEDDDFSDDRKLNKSIDTTSSCTKSSSAERDDDSDAIVLRNQHHTNRAPSACSLPQESHRTHASSFPIHYSDKSLSSSQNTKSESDSLSMANNRDVYGGSMEINGGVSRVAANGNANKSSMIPPRRPFVLHLTHEPFQNILELPSPSSASLHSGHGNIVMQELTTKSNSAPILLKKERKRDDFIGQPINLRYSRSQSDRYLAEIEAIEACKWLRAAGFPQYAQMYEDLQFPIDLSNVAKDHPFLENDPLQSLYRRLVALNRCATMRLDSAHKHGTNNKEESEDDEYALSENWTFQQTNRRWSRVGEMEIEKPSEKLSSALDTSRESSPEHNDLTDEQLGFSTLPLGVSYSQSQSEQDQLPVRLRRTGSERLKDGAKAFLRRVESIKSRRRKRQNRDGVVISGPQILDLTHINQKVNDLKCVDIVTMSTPPSPAPSSPYTTILTNNKLAAAINSNELQVITTDYLSTDKLSPNRLSPRHYISPQNSYHQHHTQSNRSSPLHFFSHNPSLTKDIKGSGDDSSSYYSDASQESSGGGGGGISSTGIPKKRPSRAKRFLQKGSKVEDIGALSDSECHQMFTRNRKYFRENSNQLTANNNNNNNEMKSSKISRGGSLNLGKESQKFKETFKTRSFRSRSSTRVKPDGELEFDRKIKSNRSSVVRWHSFQNAERPDFLFKKCSATKAQEAIHADTGTSLASMSCGQLQVVRKLALVTLTGCMERYCPTHRSGWNWELPKFIKKIKTPDYKDKRVFGVPLILLLQRTGQTLPTAIQTALKWLKLNALDQVGIFRKSGVKSRILKLKEVIEDSQGDIMETYDLQQAYDVADMVKQYFRELPDTLLTTKMSDTFVAIFQHLPDEARPDAVQSAILLLPDEHREVLQYLLEFLHNVAGHAMINQMTANNLAVCLAPSLFHGTFASPPRSTSVSPRRRKPMGMPDSRELTETRASHDCLTYMIENYRKLFTISTEKVQRCNFSYMEESRPVPLEALGEGLQVHDWRGYLYECTSATIKEGREKSRGWISVTTLNPYVDVAHKKVGDGHPLRLWRCTTEVEATPMEVLNYIFKERRQWDAYLMKCRVVEQLDDHSEIFQYATGGHVITDYCVLRSWRSDLPRGACVIVETSVAHPDATLLLGGVRGVVLASRYLIEPSINGRSKLMHLARVDTKGRSPDWYNKCYGHICSQYLSKIRSAFKHHSISSDGKP